MVRNPTIATVPPTTASAPVPKPHLRDQPQQLGSVVDDRVRNRGQRLGVEPGLAADPVPARGEVVDGRAQPPVRSCSARSTLTWTILTTP